MRTYGKAICKPGREKKKYHIHIFIFIYKTHEETILRKRHSPGNKSRFSIKGQNKYVNLIKKKKD